ncbi:CoA-disulfide reductase [Culicoidibacter larvae]|uniref:CoA-disulfide reductase n=1 Tax=Culicoidibacter larvae TaxID=2579976 RepID=A0A5R8QBB1_9FIRM|nr:CoA-disulfide reductase [Culicoidibacter larvae]TLG73869.1 CoA-disulfide reductase [Culicoidibacter larvae]
MAKRVVIIGGTAAGTSAAAKLRRVDPEADIIIYERGDIVSFGACGLPYFVGGQFDDAKRMIARTPEQFEASGVQVRTGHEVVAVYKENKTLDIRVLTSGEIISDSYDVLMIATGASPVMLDVPGNDLKGVFTLTKLADGIRLKLELAKPEVQQVTIVGAGFIGLELAEQIRHLGKDVRIIEFRERILSHVFDEEITELLEQELRDNDVELLLEEGVTGFSGDKNVTSVATDKGEYATDLVIVAVGFKPNTSFVAELGLERLENGAIVVDNQGKTSVADVFAAGDCATINHRILDKPVYIPLATTANKLGRVVGEVIGGMDSEFYGTLGSSAIQLFGLEAMASGLTTAAAVTEQLDHRSVVVNDKDHTDYVPGQSAIRVKLIYQADDKVLLGGQIVGQKNAVLRGDVLATAIHNRMRTDELGLLDLSYAPPFARTWDVLNVAGNVAK